MNHNSDSTEEKNRHSDSVIAVRIKKWLNLSKKDAIGWAGALIALIGVGFPGEGLGLALILLGGGTAFYVGCFGGIGKKMKKKPEP